MFFTLDKAVRSQNIKKVLQLPAPYRGLLRNQSYDSKKKGTAEVLENWFPTSEGAVIRRGRAKYATLTGGTPTRAIMPYLALGAGKIFAANDAGIYDISSIADPSAATAAASGIGTVTSGDFSHTMFATAGGSFLVCVNGQNLHKTFDGTTWTQNSPAITGTTSDNFSYVFSFKSRLFFIKKNTLTFAYLPVDSIGGAVSEFPLAAEFKMGGTLLMGGSWSVDSGEGLDDLCWFCTTEGEVAVFTGANPGSATDWVKVGTYQIGRPMGKKAHFKAGGDVAIATTSGLFSLAASKSKDVVAQRKSAVSWPIEELWLEYTRTRNSFAWCCDVFAARQMAIIGTPTYSGLSTRVLVVNAGTGAWCEFTGYDVRSLGVYQDRFFYGTSDGKVYEAETTGFDDGASYRCRAAMTFDDFGSPRQKFMQLVRGIFKSNFPDLRTLFSVASDYVMTWPAQPSASINPAASPVWGTAVWGNFTWGGTSTERVKTEWDGVDGAGHSLSLQCQVTLGNTVTPDIEWTSTDLVYTEGEVVA